MKKLVIKKTNLAEKWLDEEYAAARFLM